MNMRRHFLRTGAASAAALLLPKAFAQPSTWPERSVRIVVPFNAGGAADLLTRLVAERLTNVLGQPFVVENRTGAGGNIGMTAVKNAAADGYTIGSATIGTLAINQFLYSELPYDPVRDFTCITTFWENCNFLIVHADNPAKTVKEFIEWGRRKAGDISFASAGVGTTPHLAGEMFCTRVGMKATHIPFRSGAQSMPALIAGEVDFAIENIVTFLPQIKAGRLRALAVTSPYRWPTVPDIPTMQEAGVPDFEITAWGAFVVPSGTPHSIVNTLSSGMLSILKDPQVEQQFMDMGAKAVSLTPQNAAAFVERERSKWKEIVDVSGLGAKRS